jgi:transcriptional regulator with XRE-family HTH domain
MVLSSEKPEFSLSFCDITELIVALPFCHLSLKASKPSLPQYPKEFKTIGDHLRKKRLDLKLTQKEVAKQIGVDETTILNWELARTCPELKNLPNLIKFIGYLPIDPSNLTIGEKIVLYRQLQGLSQEKFARILKIDSSTLGRWEKGRGHIRQDLKKMIESYFVCLK